MQGAEVSLNLSDCRNDFQILQTEVNGHRLCYLDNAATTQKPGSVLERLHHFYTFENSNVHRGAHYLSNQAGTAYEEARQKVADFLNAPDTRQIIFTSGTTASVNLTAFSIGEALIQSGDEIIVSEMDHHSNMLPWIELCRRKSAILRWWKCPEGRALVPGEVDNLITKRTRLIAIPWVSNVTGVINPVESIIARAQAHAVPVFLDAAQAAAHLPMDVMQLDCDFLAFSGHKMYSANGIGVLYMKPCWLEKLPPWQYGGGMVKELQSDQIIPEESPARFESGTVNYPAAISLGAAIDYLSSFPLQERRIHEQSLYLYAQQRLEEIDSVTVYASEEKRCGVLSFNVGDIHPYDIGQLLDQMGVAVRTGKHCAHPLISRLNCNGTIRISFGIYNNRRDVDQLVDSLHRAIAVLEES